jgi:5'-3' exonuclease
MDGFVPFGDLEDDFSPDEIWVFFDKGGCPQRENILPQYKANRGSPPEGFPNNWNM